MKDNMTRIRICPRCGRSYHEAPALSRADNETLICPDCGTREALESIGVDEKEQELILDAMIYNVAKAIGASATVLCGKIDAILLTGGIAYSDYVISRLKKRISFLAPIYVYPGENEMESLAFNAIGALKGELPIQVYK